MSDPLEKEEPLPTDAFLFLRAIRIALGRTPLWLVTWAALSLLALVAALPWYDWFAGVPGSRYELERLVHSLDETFRFDHREGLGSLNELTGSLGAGLVLLAFLVGVFAAGGWLQVTLERSHGRSLRRFFYGGSRYFWRFTRLLVLALLVLAGLRWILYGWPWDHLVLMRLLGVPEGDLGDLHTLDSELHARMVGWAQDGLFALATAGVVAWAIYSRARLALHDTSSVLWAAMCSVGMIVRHPIKTLRPLLFLFLFQLVVLLALGGLATSWLDESLREDPSAVHVLLMLLAGQIALAWREVTRGAYYYAAVKVSQEVVGSSGSRPDPWNAIGGPGGPQYPLGGDDEYAVSM